MASIKYRHCLKIYEITLEMTKYLSICKMQQNIAHYIVSRNTLYNKNEFPIVKTEAILSLIESISKKKSLYIEALKRRDLAFDRRDLVNIDKNFEQE